MTEAEKYAKEWGINLNGGDICFDKIMLLSFIKSFAAEQVAKTLGKLECNCDRLQSVINEIKKG